MNAETGNDQAQTDSKVTDIAIVGMSCRYPGDAASPRKFWEFLLRGGDGIVDVPADRWDSNAYYDADKEKPNKMYVKRGGFIRNIDQFDPQFFNISPKEAPHIDPQHRWLLELTQEAFENAGLSASELKGSDTAVYIGQFMHDYEQIQLDSMARSMMSSHSATGPSMTLTANRISYAFDFIGPSVTLDTACSSSLVALDLACKAIINGDSKLAIAGGVNILLRPELTMSICKASMLSPDGRCKSFDASANGYVRSEGAGLVVVKNLAEAQRDGDNILAVIKATGVNQDGQTIGITVPNGESQKKLLRKTLGRARIASSDVQYAEAHGTGTAVGDPIEVNALGAILGDRDSALTRCVIGSVKSNIGHSEAAAGVAGLIKTVMAMNEGVIPQNIHYHNTNPGINLKELNVDIAAKQLPWPDIEGKPRRAIVNSFGFGGTNANVVLEQAPSREVGGSDQKPVINSDLKLLPISSKTEKGLIAQAEQYAAYLEGVATSAKENLSLLHDICYTAATKRDHYKYRLVVNGTDFDEMLLGLNEYTEGKPSTGYVNAAVNVETGKEICFVFSGMGTTWAGMGKDLYHAEPVFKAMMDRCDEALQKLGGWSLLDALFSETDPEKIHETYLAQPAIFATQVSLAELLNSWGVTPHCIVGHSAGEVGAAYAAGVYSFEDAIKVIYHRSRLQHTTEGMGKMLAVALTEEALQPYIAGHESAISIAAVNSEDALTLSGDEQVLTEIAAQLDDQGVFARFLNVGVPYHSPAMDQLKQPLIDEITGIRVNPPHTPLYSTVSGQLTKPGDWTAEYWPDNVREPVRFKAAIDNIVKQGIKAFVEIAPHTALSSSIKKNLAQHSDAGAVIGTLKRDQNGVVMLSQTLASLHAAGLPLDWQKLYPNGGNFATLPNYAWQHAGYWHESEEVKQCRLKNISKRGGFSESEHPLVGGRLHSTTPFWQNVLDLQQQSYLQDHQVEGEVVYPGAAYIEMALFIARQATQQESITLENVDFKRAFFLEKDKPTIIETTYDAAANRYKISAVETQTEQWEVFSEGVVSDVAKPKPATCITLSEIKALLPNTMGKADFYEHCHKLGLSYQRDFQAVENAWYSDNDALVEIQLPESIVSSNDEYLLHPSILDGAFQSLFPTINSGYLPVKINELHYFKKPGSQLYCHLVTKFKDDSEIKGDLTLFDADGGLLVEIIGVELKSTKTQLSTTDDSILYDYRWLKEALPESREKAESAEENLWIIFADAGGVGKRLAQHLEGQAQSVCFITQAADVDQVDSLHFGLNIQSSDDVLPVLNTFSQNCRGLVYLWGLDNPACESLSAEELLDSCQATAVTPLHIAQALDKVEWRHTQKVFFASRSAQAVDNECLPQPSQTALWGFGRVFASEYPDYSVSLVDLPESIDDNLLAQFANEVVNDEYEQEIALRNSARYVNRLRKLHQSELQEYAGTEIQLEADAAFQISRNGKHNPFVQTVLQSFVLPDLTTDEVAIKVAYAGVNHYDLDTILAHNSGAGNEEAAQTGQGFECVGTVVSIGPNMTTLSVGDEVMAFARQGLSSIVHANAQSVTKIPAHLSLEQAATIPAAFLTAHYSLNQLAVLREGESVLIHEAAESVGLAAIQLARAKNAILYVTANTQEKRDYLRSLGLSHVYDSTTFEFVQGIGSPARGAGIDIVLNQLTGQFVDKTIGLMNPFGRLVEMGQRATRTSSGLADALCEKNISYHSVNTLELVSQRPELCAELMRELLSLFECKTLEPLPVKVFTADQATDGIAYAAEKTKANKVVVGFDVPGIRVSQGVNRQLINSHSSYLVTGGLGGLGREIMHWLADKGAKSIVLIGRSAPSESAQAAMEVARSKGITVNALQADVTNADDVRKVLATIEKDMLPLAGIIHSAGVLEDGTIAQQTAEKFQKVLSPKVKGAWNLHQLTAHIELEFFVCFSSIASIVGWAGQSNYAAANAFMDGLAFHRKALGKSALTINWGPWGGAGMAANLDDRELQRMTDAGMTPLESANGLAAMATLLEYRVPQSGVFDLNWSLIFKQYTNPSKKTVFKDFASDLETTTSVNFMDELMAVSADKHAPLLLKQIGQVMAEVLGIEDSAGIDKHVSVFEYGLNSLMSMDFRNKLQAVLQLKLPSTLVLKYPTIDAMTKYIMQNVLVDHGKTYQDISTVSENQTVKVSI